MSMLRLKQIVADEEDAYDILLEADDGEDLHIRCEVFVHGGVTGVRPIPDVFMTADLDVRAVAAAVLAVHRARTPQVG